jgi:hypothetical protein
MAAPDSQIEGRQSTLPGITARLWWMFIGNLLLAFCIIFIVQKGGGFFHTADWVFWIGLASLVLVRYVDIRVLDGCTGTGEPASIRHWIRYAALLTACSTVLWVLAHVTGYLFAMRNRS